MSSIQITLVCCYHYDVGIIGDEELVTIVLFQMSSMYTIVHRRNVWLCPTGNHFIDDLRPIGNSQIIKNGRWSQKYVQKICYAARPPSWRELRSHSWLSAFLNKLSFPITYCYLNDNLRYQHTNQTMTQLAIIDQGCSTGQELALGRGGRER